MDNPWQVESLWAFAHLHCPECAFSTQEESFFQCHAIQTHPLSSVLFGTEIHEETFVKQEPMEYNESYEDPTEFCDTSIEKPKRAPKMYLTLAEKLDVIKMHESGIKFSKIGKAKGINESSVRAIWKRKDALMAQGASANYQSSSKILQTRTRTMEETEKLLSAWILDQEQQGTPPEQSKIQTEARRIFIQIKDNLEDKTEKEIKENFLASNGWFANFKKRNKAQNEISTDLADENKIFLPSTSYGDSPTKQEIIDPNLDEGDFLQNVNPAIKKTHKTVTLAEKLDIIKLFENGIRFSKIALFKEMAESTVRTICKKKEKIKARAATTNFKNTKGVLARTRTIEHMEKHLLSWIFNLIQKGAPLGYSKVQKKAKFLYFKIKDNLADKTEGEIKENFKASNGWLARFRKRKELEGIDISGKNFDVGEIKEDKQLPLPLNLPSTMPSTSHFLDPIAIKQELMEPCVDIEELEQNPGHLNDENRKSDLIPSKQEQQETPKIPTNPIGSLLTEQDIYSDIEIPVVKRTKTYLTLEEKLQIILLYETGSKTSQIAKVKGMPESSVRVICNKKEKYKAQSEQGASGKLISIRSRILERMEDVLSSWMLDVEQRGIQIKNSQIQAKGRTLFLHIQNNLEDKTEDEVKETFEASNGWLHNFRKRRTAKSSEGPANVDPLDIMTCYQLPDANDFVCDICGFSTFSNAKLRKHRYEKHEPEKHKPCPYCEYKSPNADCINVHIDRLHPEHGEKTFYCDTCGKGFIFKTSFHEHKWFYCPRHPEYKGRNSGASSSRHNKPTLPPNVGPGLLSVEKFLAMSRQS